MHNPVNCYSALAIGIIEIGVGSVTLRRIYKWSKLPLAYILMVFTIGFGLQNILFFLVFGYYGSCRTVYVFGYTY